MQFANRIKGAVTQALLRALLEDSGYRIIPFGVEETWRELAQLKEQDYLALRLPKTLRQLPDFFVSDYPIKNTWLVEVKYRKEWSNSIRDELGSQLLEQVNHWSPLYLIVFLGGAAEQTSNKTDSCMGIVRLTSENGELFVTTVEDPTPKKWSDISWKAFGRIQKVFKTLSTPKKLDEQTLRKVQKSLSQLTALDATE